MDRSEFDVNCLPAWDQEELMVRFRVWKETVRRLKVKGEPISDNVALQALWGLILEERAEQEKKNASG